MAKTVTKKSGHGRIIFDKIPKKRPAERVDGHEQRSVKRFEADVRRPFERVPDRRKVDDRGKRIEVVVRRPLEHINGNRRPVKRRVKVPPKTTCVDFWDDIPLIAADPEPFNAFWEIGMDERDIAELDMEIKRVIQLEEELKRLDELEEDLESLHGRLHCAPGDYNPYCPRYPGQ